MPHVVIHTINDIHKQAQLFLHSLPHNHKVIAFEGDMGVGKTTFIKAICKNLGVDDVVNSPTFSIVNEYATPEGGAVYHFDFYRIKTPQEALDFGIYDYLDSGNWCFMEWAENIATLLPPETLFVYLTENPDGSRNIRF